MPRFGFNSLLIVALGVGVCFELIKRINLPVNLGQGSELAQMGQSLSRPYSRSNIDLRGSLKPRVLRPHVDNNFRLQARGRLVIPPILPEGKFDSHAPSAGEKTKTTDAQAKKDEKKLKFCPPEDFKEKSAEMPIALNAAGMAVAKPESENKYAAPGEECVPEEKEKVAKKEDEAPSDEAKEDEEVADIEAAEGPLTFNGGLDTQIPKEKNLPGLEEWKSRVLAQPNLRETLALVDAAQKGQISMALFIAVTKLMLKDGRQEMQELGVFAIGRVPSFDSFHSLVNILKKETFGSRLRQKAEAEINAYEQLEFLPILARVMRDSSDTIAVIWATKQLDDSAKRFLTAKYNRPKNPPASGHTYARYYSGFVNLLQEITRGSRDVQEVSQARQTLQSLQDLLKSFT